MKDIKKNFPDFGDKELPDRQFIWDILSILRPLNIKRLKETAIENIGVEKEDKEYLINFLLICK